MSYMLSVVSEAFVEEARSAGVRFSESDELTSIVRLHHGCLGPLEWNRAHIDLPQSDDDCMTDMARSLKTEWLLSGLMVPERDGYLVEAHLSSAADSRRNVRLSFYIADAGSARDAVRGAWRQMTNVTTLQD